MDRPELFATNSMTRHMHKEVNVLHEQTFVPRGQNKTLDIHSRVLKFFTAWPQWFETNSIQCVGPLLVVVWFFLEVVRLSHTPVLAETMGSTAPHKHTRGPRFIGAAAKLVFDRNASVVAATLLGDGSDEPRAPCVFVRCG